MRAALVPLALPPIYHERLSADHALLDVIVNLLMPSQVPVFVKHHKIFQPIVQRVAVDVMNVLIRFQLSA